MQGCEDELHEDELKGPEVPRARPRPSLEESLSRDSSPSLQQPHTDGYSKYLHY